MDCTFQKVLYFTQTARKVFIHITGERPQICVSEQSSWVAMLENTEDKALGAKDTAACVSGLPSESAGVSSGEGRVLEQRDIQ